MKHVVIVGGGFAGLNCARKLAKRSDVRITLIDKNNYQQFQPLLYQVASGFLAPSNVAFSLRNMLVRHPNIEVTMDEVVSADLAARTVTTVHKRTFDYDYLVLAAGSVANFFGTPGADKHTYPLYSLHDAELLRSRILSVLEAADRDQSLIAKGALNFILVGAGPTGTEMSGTMGDMIHHAFKQEYPNLPLDKVGIHVVDMGGAVLCAFSEKAQAYAAKKLAERDVKVHLHTAVKEVAADHVVLSDNSHIPTHCVIWAGGLRASPLSGNLGLRPGHGGRLDVQADLTLPGFFNVYAIGDFANITDRGKPLPQLASVAEQAGKWCAKNIEADIDGKARKPFDYFDKGIMAMIGRSSAVAEIGPHRHELEGPIAFTAWLGVHAALLSTMRARIEAFVEWAWDYFSEVRGDQVLDRFSQEDIDWSPETSAPPAATEAKKATDS
jgi:NADH:ubiquinone reductase (H+-translocating)